MSDTKIEWASKVWNPIVGCSVTSPGCTNCYAVVDAQPVFREARGTILKYHWLWVSDAAKAHWYSERLVAALQKAAQS